MDETTKSGAVVSANSFDLQGGGQVITAQLANRSVAAEASLDVARIENPFDVRVGYCSQQVTLPGSESLLRHSLGFDRSTPLGSDNLHKIITIG